MIDLSAIADFVSTAFFLLVIVIVGGYAIYKVHAVVEKWSRRG